MSDLVSALQHIPWNDKPKLAARYTELVSIVHAFERMEKSPGWTLFSEIVQANALTVQNERSTSYFTSPEDVYKDQYMKGVSHGLRQALILLPASLDAYREMRDRIAQVLQQESDNGSSPNGNSDVYDRLAGEPPEPHEPLYAP